MSNNNEKKTLHSPICLIWQKKRQEKKCVACLLLVRAHQRIFKRSQYYASRKPRRARNQTHNKLLCVGIACSVCRNERRQESSTTQPYNITTQYSSSSSACRFFFCCVRFREPFQGYGWLNNESSNLQFFFF